LSTGREGAGQRRAPLPPDHKEGQRVRERVEAPDLGVAAVKHVQGAWFDDHRVELRNIGGLPVRGLHEGRDATPQLEERMELHGRLGSPEAGPRAQRVMQYARPMELRPNGPPTFFPA
jgi:hypothetical protein